MSPPPRRSGPDITPLRSPLLRRVHCSPVSGARRLHFALDLQALSVAENRRNREPPVPHQVRDGTVVCFKVAVNLHAVPPFGVSDVVNSDVVMLAPEERHRVEHLAVSEHVARRGLSLTLGDHPMLDANSLSSMRIGPTRHVTGGK